MLTTPKVKECPSAYWSYIELVQEDVIDTLIFQSEKLVALLLSLREEQWEHRYDLNKWSVREVIGHLIDNEIIMLYRLIRISRGDTTPLSGYAQDAYINTSPYKDYTSSDMIQYYKSIRQLTLATLRGIPAESWLKKGFIGDNEISARSLAYVIAGHEIHHIKIIHDKYLV
jgi:hypothetical protein